jgi:hypothetical protein
MKYEKPAITHMAEALCAIQSPHSKLNPAVADNLQDYPEMSIAAYEADE